MQAFSRRKHAQETHGRSRHLALRMERVYRGHLGRLSFEESQQERDRALRLAFWAENAIMIQRIFRGFSSRKTKHNFYLRKHYLASVAAKGEEIRAEVDRHYFESKAVHEHQTAVARLESFEKVVGSLHHMLSTGSCAGVYNSPYHTSARATVYGMPLEEHLENVAKGTLRHSILRFGTNTGFVHSSQGELEATGAGEAMQTSAGLYAYSTKPIQITRAH